MEDAFGGLSEYYHIISVQKNSKHHVMLHYTTLLNTQQTVIFVYYTRGNTIFLEFCYPLTAGQYDSFVKNKVAQTKTKRMASGYRAYKDIPYAYSNLRFNLSDGLDFEDAFGYLLRRLERVLQAC